MSVFHALYTTDAQTHRHLVKDFTIVEGPPLPGAVLASETANYLLATRVLANVRAAVEDNGVYYYDWSASAVQTAHGMRLAAT